jgi:hypothetical protein
VALAAATVIIGLNGLGQPDLSGDGLTADQVVVAGVPLSADEPVEVDLTEPMAITVADPPAAATQAEVALSAVRIPLGTSDTAGVQAGPEGILTAVSASALRITASGPVTAELRLLDDGSAVLATRQFTLDQDRAAYLTVAGVVAIILILMVLAYASSVTARLRRGRRDRGAYPKLAVVGVLAGVAATLVGWSFLDADLTAVTLVVSALLGGAGAVVGGIVVYRLAVRRRLLKVIPQPT